MYNIKQAGFFILLFVVGMFPIEANAQSPDSLLIQLSRKWDNAKNYAIKMAALMPEENYDFRPVPEQMSFKEQILHTIRNMNWLSSSYLFARKPNKTDTANLSKDAIIKLLRAAYDSALIVHYGLTEKQLDERVSFFAGPLTRRQILILMHDHQTHHISQLIVYLRLKGIKPPDYVGW